MPADPSRVAQAVSLVTNPMIRDRRVEQTALALGEIADSVAVLAFDPGGALPRRRTLGAGVEVQRLSTTNRSPAMSEEPTSTSSRSSGVRSSRYPRPLVRTVLPIVAMVRAAVYGVRSIAAARKLRPGLVWANDLPTMPSAVAIARLTGAPLVFDSHELYTERVTDRPFDGWWRAAERRIERALIRRADLVVTVSVGIAEQLRDRYELADLPIVVQSIPDDDRDEVHASDVRTDAGVDGGHQLVVYTGVIAPARGVDLAIRAVAAAGPATSLAVVGYGRGAHLDELEELARALGASDRVHFLDPVNPVTLVDYVSTADVAVIPGRAASLNSQLAMPNKLFEALRAGLPLVAHDKAEIARFIRQHRIGRVIDAADTDAFRDALVAVRSDETLVDAVAEAQRTQRWALEAERLRDQLRELLSR